MSASWLCLCLVETFSRTRIETITTGVDTSPHGRSTNAWTECWNHTSGKPLTNPNALRQSLQWHCFNTCQVPNGGTNGLQQIHQTELLHFNVYNWTKVWYSLLNQFMKEKISDQFLPNWKMISKSLEEAKRIYFMASCSFALLHQWKKCEELNLKCTALFCVNALHNIFWSGSQCPKAETIKNTISICLICLWDHEFRKIIIKLIVNQNAMLIRAIQFAIHIV